MITALSASQLKTFTLCPRKWAFDKRDRVPRPDTQNPLGTRVHEILEAWYPLHPEIDALPEAP